MNIALIPNISSSQTTTRRGRQARPLDPGIMETLQTSYDGSLATTRTLAEQYQVSASTIRAWAKKLHLTQRSRPRATQKPHAWRIVLAPTHDTVHAQEEMQIGPDTIIDVKDATEAYLQEMSHYARLSAGEERELAARVASGDKAAKDRMIQANLRLVVRIASLFAERVSGKIDVLDLIQEGNLGLMHAVETFDLGRGCRFSTHATWWIRQAISKAILDQARIIRLPIPTQEQLLQLRRLCLQAELDLPMEELAQRLSISDKRVKELFAAAQDAMSLDVPLEEAQGDDSVLSLGDSIPSPLPSPEAHVFAADLRQHMQRLLCILSPREQEVLVLRFGLLDGIERTLDEVSGEFGVTRERIRQIERRALSRLLKTSLDLRLHDYLEV
jgi:RNA polymerase primary sigma factor